MVGKASCCNSISELYSDLQFCVNHLFGKSLHAILLYSGNRKPAIVAHHVFTCLLLILGVTPLESKPDWQWL